MSRAICDGCGKDSHIELELRSDGFVHDRIGNLNFCESCGAYVAGVLFVMLQRFKTPSSFVQG